MKSRFALALAVVGMLAGQFAFIGHADAKRAKCFSVPVPGQPGVFIGQCTTTRP